ncbi:hypothetical protein WJX73_004654 [Symbiochloris irregularis]|uniref:F-box domain-containing protein n=1 Tax=Symbiochloris irregularis TaxID=706552 RepID=A0AAW1NSY5_9CHLO
MQQAGGRSKQHVFEASSELQHVLLWQVFPRLTVHELAALSCSCKFLRDLLQQDDIWDTIDACHWTYEAAYGLNVGPGGVLVFASFDIGSGALLKCNTLRLDSVSCFAGHGVDIRAAPVLSPFGAFLAVPFSIYNEDNDREADPDDSESSDGDSVLQYEGDALLVVDVQKLTVKHVLYEAGDSYADGSLWNPAVILGDRIFVGARHGSAKNQYRPRKLRFWTIRDNSAEEVVTPRGKKDAQIRPLISPDELMVAYASSVTVGVGNSELRGVRLIKFLK